jgi:hypothetical protein
MDAPVSPIPAAHMTRRDHFAAAAMAEILREQLGRTRGEGAVAHFDPRDAWALADAMEGARDASADELVDDDDPDEARAAWEAEILALHAASPFTSAEVRVLPSGREVVTLRAPGPNGDTYAGELIVPAGRGRDVARMLLRREAFEPDMTGKGAP